MFDRILDKGRKQQRRHKNLPYLPVSLYPILEAVDTCARQIQISAQKCYLAVDRCLRVRCVTELITDKTSKFSKHGRRLERLVGRKNPNIVENIEQKMRIDLLLKKSIFLTDSLGLRRVMRRVCSTQSRQNIIADVAPTNKKSVTTVPAVERITTSAGSCLS